MIFGTDLMLNFGRNKMDTLKVIFYVSFALLVTLLIVPVAAVFGAIYGMFSGMGKAVLWTSATVFGFLLTFGE